MGELKLKPDIRFAGFADAWEQRKLDDVADIVGGGTPSTNINEYWGGDVDWYAPAEIGEQIFLTGSQKNITELGLQNSSAKILPIGTVLFTSRAGIGNTAILAKTGATNQGFQSIVPHKDELDSYFIFSRTHELKRYGETVGAGSTFVEVSGKQMAKMPIRVPEISEQKKIGKLFAELDNLISLHQREYGKTVNIKKAMLEKMFPKDGANRPEIRFAGFTDAWEQRKLSDVLTVRRILQRQTPDAPRLAFASGQGVIDLSERRTNNRDQLIADEKTKIYLLTEYDDIVYNPANLKYGAIDRNKFGRGVISPIYVTFTTEEKPSFVERIVTTEKFKIKALQFEEGTVVKRQSVSPENLLSFEEYISAYRDEQKMIGDFFDNLDCLIALHKREFEKLKNMKKALLQKMFV